jgi:hypothetical protein
MSITGISAASSAAYIQQLQNAIQSGTTATATTAQTAGPTQTDAGAQPSPTQQTGQARHHHHHGGGESAAPSADLTQSSTAAASGTNILNTLV